MNKLISRYGKFLFLLSLGLMILPIAGCWDRNEINDLALVTAAAIDKKGKETIELSVQVFIPRMRDGGQMGQLGGIGGGGAQTLVRSAKGKTIADAMAKLQERFPRTIFWGHADVYIFGEKIAKTGIREMVDFILRFPLPRERANVFVSKGEAKKILELLPPLERNQAEVLRELSESRIGMHVTVKELAEMLIGDAGNAALPLLEILPPSAGGKQLTIAYIVGTAVFRKDKMIGYINDMTTRGLLWLRNEIKYAVVTVAPKEAEGFVSFNLLRSYTKLIPHIEDGRWSMTVRIITEDDIMENTTNLDLMDSKCIQLLEEMLRQDIIHRVNMTLNQVQKKMKTDILGFAEAFHRKYPDEWQRVKQNWDDKFPNVSVNVEAEAKIKRSGKSGPIVNRPEDEMLNK